MSEDPKPCPFCGSTDVAHRSTPMHFFQCFNCGAEGPPKSRFHSGIDHGHAATRAAALAVWNQRAAPSEPGDL